jgi:hypothetical protein
MEGFPIVFADLYFGIKKLYVFFDCREVSEDQLELSLVLG